MLPTIWCSRELSPDYLFKLVFQWALTLCQLLSELKSEGWKYILTSRLNQDVCEKFFSPLRGFGGPDTQLDRIQVLQRAKMRLMVKDGESIVSSAGQSVEDEEMDAFIDYPSSGLIQPEDVEENDFFQEEESV